MSEITILTNNVPRELLQAWQLSKTELAEFDYLIDSPKNATDEELQELWFNSGAEFFRYRGQLYDMSQFSRILASAAKSCNPRACAEPSFQGWDGYASDSYFSGILVKYARDEFGIVDGRIVVATYYS